MNKRILSVILSFMMIVCMIPMGIILPASAAATPKYMYVTNIDSESCNVYWKRSITSMKDALVEYSYTGTGSWATALDIANGVMDVKIALNPGQTVYFRGEIARVEKSNTKYISLKYESSSGRNGALRIGGDLTTLLNKTGNVLDLTAYPEYTFSNLFQENSAVSEVADDCCLPSTVLTKYCYDSMFQKCSNLIKIPENLLPATTLADRCYRNMFEFCDGLSYVPEKLLPATTLAVACYQSMFSRCSNLKNGPDLPAEHNSFKYCYNGMFSLSESLETVRVNFKAWNEATNSTLDFLHVCLYDKEPNIPAFKFYCPKELDRTTVDDRHIPTNLKNLIVFNDGSTTKSVYIDTIKESVRNNVFTKHFIYLQGETVNVTVKPDEGYRLKKLVYNDGTDHDITATKQFTMPAKNVTIDAEFELIPTHTHTFSTDWSKNETAHWHECTATGCDITNYTGSTLAGVAYGEHTYVDGVCSVCGKKAPCAHAHKEIINVVTATCVDAGYTGDVFCIDCETIIEEGTSTLIDPDNHAGSAVLDDSTVVAATCISGGYSGDYYCECCNELIILGDDTDIDPNNHAGSAVLDDSTVVAATCISAGYTGDKICDACNEIVISGTSTDIDPNNHVGEAVLDDSTVVAATCISAGYTGDKICNACNEIVIAGTATDIDPDNHSFTGEYKDNGDGATHSRKCVNGCGAYGDPQAHIGMEDFICDDCGYTDVAGQLAKAKEEAKKAVEDLASDGDSDEVTAIIEKALEDIEKAISTEELDLIVENAEKDVADQKAAEAAAEALAEAKEAAKAAIDAELKADDTDEVKEIAENAKKAIDEADTLDEVKTEKDEGIEAIRAARNGGSDEPDGDACPKCGGHHGNSFFDKLVCLLTRIITMLIDAFNTVC